MCGICGELCFGGDSPAVDLLDRMLPALARRGPDDEGRWSAPGVAFGHRRLSIIDLSERSHQPMPQGEQRAVDQPLGQLPVHRRSCRHECVDESARCTVAHSPPV